MNRRSFLRNSGLAGISLGALSITGCQSARDSKNDSQEFDDSFELMEYSVADLQDAMEKGRYSSADITRLYLKRIEAIDRSGPKLNSVIELNPDAIAIAEMLDKERAEGRVRGPLHGIPVLLKDNIDTGDKMQTTAGALALEGNRASKDAFIVAQLRSAGAVILGKTNLSEWANFRSSRSCSGWSSRGGQTKSPYLLTHNPCGSSSGSGVSIAANLAAIAVGTETDGSIVCPSSACGLVGIKPTVGLVSRSGIIPISHTQDTAGPMARTVRDAAILLSVLAGSDAGDAATNHPYVRNLQSRQLLEEYTKELHPDALNGRRIGIEKKPQGDNHHIHALLEKCKEILRAKGAIIVELEYLDQLNELGGAEFEVLQYEFKDGVNRYLASSNAPVKTLSEVIAFNQKNEDRAMPYFKQNLLEACDTMGDLNSADYKKALEASHKGSQKILDEVMERNQLDALAGITMGPSCAIDPWYGDRWGDVSLTQPAATSGYPHITVPAAQVYDLPVGFSFFGKPFSEASLIGMAFAFEQATAARKKPEFRASL
jgi:amidase